jgi:sulfide dehydrogenase cytochrome subunit
LAALALAAPPPAAAEPPIQLLAGGCQGCHGVSGRGANGIPAIAGTRSRSEFEASLKAFRANERDGTIMGRIARGYTDAEIAALATHYGRAQ